MIFWRSDNKKSRRTQNHRESKLKPHALPYAIHKVHLDLEEVDWSQTHQLLMV